MSTGVESRRYTQRSVIFIFVVFISFLIFIIRIYDRTIWFVLNSMANDPYFYHSLYNSIFAIYWFHDNRCKVYINYPNTHLIWRRWQTVCCILQLHVFPSCLLSSLSNMPCFFGMCHFVFQGEGGVINI